MAAAPVAVDPGVLIAVEAALELAGQDRLDDAATKIKEYCGGKTPVEMMVALVVAAYFEVVSGSGTYKALPGLHTPLTDAKLKAWQGFHFPGRKIADVSKDFKNQRRLLKLRVAASHIRKKLEENSPTRGNPWRHGWSFSYLKQTRCRECVTGTIWDGSLHGPEGTIEYAVKQLNTVPTREVGFLRGPGPGWCVARLTLERTLWQNRR